MMKSDLLALKEAFSKPINQKYRIKIVILILFTIIFSPIPIHAQQKKQTQDLSLTKPNLFNEQERVQIDADRWEIHDEENIAIFTGNVSALQGQNLLKSEKMTIHYTKAEQSTQQDALSVTNGITIDHLEVEDKVYIRFGTRIATGDRGTYDNKTQTMTLLGRKVTLSDDDNVATGCKLTIYANKNIASLESCKGEKDRVSVVLVPKKEPEKKLTPEK